MLKILSTLATIFLLVNAAEHEMHNSHQMFQTVSAKEATLVQEGEDKDSCSRCGMNLVQFYKTSHASQQKGTQHQYCSLHCLEEHLGKGVHLKSLKVVDVSSLKLINVEEAYYGVGSKKSATMSRVSKYAFLKESDAKKFQAENGGEIMNFEGAREKAQEDFN